MTSYIWDEECGGGQGGAARENRGWERSGSGSRNKAGDSLLFTTGYYSVKNTYLAKFEISI